MTNNTPAEHELSPAKILSLRIENDARNLAYAERCLSLMQVGPADQMLLNNEVAASCVLRLKEATELAPRDSFDPNRLNAMQNIHRIAELLKKASGYNGNNF